MLDRALLTQKNVIYLYFDCLSCGYQQHHIQVLPTSLIKHAMPALKECRYMVYRNSACFQVYVGLSSKAQHPPAKQHGMCMCPVRCH